jgi:casein kinase I family protein HRR25
MIANKYKLLEQIGSGSFGCIYKGENIRTHKLVAIKVEPIKYDLKLLKRESKIYQNLSGSPNIPIVKWFGKDSENYYMVINLLGDSLQDLKAKQKNNVFSFKSTLQIGIKILEILKYIHEKELVHRDIKPDNFLLSLDRKHIYIIDFGFCKRYINSNGNHIENKKLSNMIGSPNYASINAHKYNELSRRDDLESLGYMLCYLYYGKLRWENEKNMETVCTMKQQFNQLQNDNGRNNEINNEQKYVLHKYLKYVTNLKFDETPNYNYVINVFMDTLKYLEE